MASSPRIFTFSSVWLIVNPSKPTITGRETLDVLGYLECLNDAVVCFLSVFNVNVDPSAVPFSHAVRLVAVNVQRGAIGLGLQPPSRRVRGSLK